jgi:GTP pyrophosphokinase
MIRFEDVERKVERHHPDADIDLLRRAYIYSAKAHKDQMRASGEPYLIHPLSVAEILADLKLDVPTVCTGLLHDVVEDTLATVEDIEEMFGKDVASLVDGVTKISNLGKVSKEQAQAENLRKMVLAMVGDIRVVLVKLADRTHNMRTLAYLKPEKRKRIAEETLDVYAPIAHRLGMSKIRAELEDLSFQYLHPEEYKRLREDVERRRASTEHFIDEVKAKIAQRLTEHEVPYIRIEGRIKRLYSIFLKLQRQKVALDKVYDLAAIRIITHEPRDCYFALGVMHEYWKPFNDRIKDFIAKPRENGYQSLHTSVVGDEGYHFEVQIRTEEMHRIAEEGVAAHWKYKEGKGQDSSEDETMKWLRRLVEWQQDVSDAREFVDSFKLELYPKEVYALTPQGKVIQLPANSTPIDFAYAVHSGLGDECTGAKVHGRIVPLRYQIQNGDKIEIIRTPGHQPSRDWLNFVVTSKARNRIKKFIADKQRAESLELGRKLFDKEIARLRLKPKAVLDDPLMQKYLIENGYAKFDDLLAAIGYGKVTARIVLARFLPEDKLAELDRAKTSGFQKATRAVKRVLRLGDDRISIKGNIDGVMYYRAPCCNPIRGEQIIGYITIGKGVGVHAVRCKNAANLMVNRERIIEVNWEGAGDPYPVKLSVLTHDRTGQLAALTNKIAEIKTNIRSASTDDDSLNDGTRMIALTVDVSDVTHLDRVIVALKGIEGVLEVERLNALPPHN